MHMKIHLLAGEEAREVQVALRLKGIAQGLQ